jgi:hypothetical protein
MSLRPRRRNLVVWSQSAGPAQRGGGLRLTRSRRIRRWIRTALLLTVVTLWPAARAVRARWRVLAPGVVLTVAGVIMRGSPAGSLVLLPGLVLLLYAPLLPGTPGPDSVRRSKLERELAGYSTTRQQFDLGATLDRYPDGVTYELRDILARQGTATAQQRIPGCGRG